MTGDGVGEVRLLEPLHLSASSDSCAEARLIVPVRQENVRVCDLARWCDANRDTPVGSTTAGSWTGEAPLIRYATEESGMTVSDIAQNRRELAHRASNGVDVHLYWNATDDTLVVTVADDDGESFELDVDSHEALDAFEHPYAYAALRRPSATVDLAA